MQSSSPRGGPEVPARQTPPLRSHPLLAVGRRYIVIGAIPILLGVLFPILSLNATIIPLSFLLAALGVFLVWNGVVLRTLGGSMPILNAAAGALAHGQLEEAERLHAQLPAPLAERAIVKRVLAVQRSMIALSRGEAEAAARHAEPATDPRVGLFTGGYEGLHRAEAFALRAEARAAMGEVEPALADAREVEASPFARGAALARIGLARAIVLARSGDKAALSAHLAERGNLILEHSMPRERSLLRALRALARAPGKSVYRESARPKEDEESKKLRSWIAQVVPDAAAFAPDQREASSLEHLLTPAAIDPNAMAAIASARRMAAQTKRRARWPLILGLWASLVMLFLALWQFLTPAERVRPGEVPVPEPVVEEAPSLFLTYGSPVILGVFAVLVLGTIIARYRKHERIVLEAERDAALDRKDLAKAKLAKVAGRRNPVISASVHLQLASIANREGDFGRAVAEADQGIAILSTNAVSQAIASDLATPGLITERAYALAALGRFREAETEIATMAQAYPTYPFLSRAAFSVRLITAVRSGDAKRAAELAMSRTPDLPIDLRTDLLCDVILAESGEPMGADERERIHAELRDLPAIARWIDDLRKSPLVRVAPLGEAPRRDDAPPSSDYLTDEAATEEAAEEEAAEAMSPARARRAAQGRNRRG